MNQNEKQAAERADVPASGRANDSPNPLVPVYWLVGFIVLVLALFLIGQGT